MISNNYRFMVFFFTIILSMIFFLPNLDTQKLTEENQTDRARSTSSPKASIEMKKGRWEYFHRMLKDPATGEIPKGIRQKELAFAKELQEKTNSLQKSTNIMDLGWKEAGPNDVGGRTRALAIDITDPNTIIAGGVSGGMWKSTDKGATWQMKSTTNQILSVTTVAQDPRSGFTNNWYYGTGECLWGNSAQDIGGKAIFCGDGIYKSTDNGETWNILPVTDGTNPTSWSKSFDFIQKIAVNPKTGSVFVTTFYDGIFRSTDGGNSFSQIFGKEYNHYYSDIDISTTGTIAIVVSSTKNTITPQNSPGVYKSTNDGESWTNITPQTFPNYHLRSIIALANDNIAYVITFTGEVINDREDIRFHKINVANGSSEDLSENMPSFPGPWGGDQRIFSQNNYNLTLAIKPDDENFVMIGATNLYRSTNGFATKPNSAKFDWIGGYNLEATNYPNLHADIHSFAFDPTNPNAMWWGHDGGLSYTSDIRNTSYQTFFPWDNKNNGYNVTQFYMITISNQAGDDRIMGGTQDNGTPYFRSSGGIPGSSIDVSSGDGSYAYIGKDFAYSSAQFGRVLRLRYDLANNVIPPFTGDESKPYKDITPSEAANQLFIDPFTIDPNNEEIMYYFAGNVIWRNNQLSSVPDDYSRGTTIGWSKLEALTVPSGLSLSALAISQSNPSHRLYFGASDYNDEPGPPKIYKLDNANIATSGAIDISIPSAPNNAYLHNIAVNPDNADELIVIFSNYNIPSIFHSNNAGQSFSLIEGNLEGTHNNPGPSVRAATILPTSSGTLYLVATSTGVYSASQLNGAQTTWALEGANSIGNVVVNYLASRKSDGRIVAGTHGRGAFVGQADAAGAAVATANVTSLTLQSRPGQTGSTSFVLSNDGEANLNYNISVTGSFGSALPKISKNNKSMVHVEFTEKKSTNFRKGLSKIPFLPKSRNGTMQIPKRMNLPSSVSGNDVLWLDDGNEVPDDFDGWDNGWSMYWANEFNLSGISFDLDAIQFCMITEESYTNEIHYTVSDANLNLLAEEYLSLDLSPTGSWYTIPLKSVVSFNAGETFYIGIESNSLIYYPAGIDYNAQIKNKSYYYNWNTWTWDNINTFSGYENAAYLIRAIGTVGGGGGNQDPVAVVSVSKTQADVNESITFDGSQSYDNDGNITQYMWDFGDGATSNQQSATHAYSQPNTYNYSLTVTDNQGATGQKTGQIIVSETSSNYVTVDPASGTIQSGNSQTITLTLNAQNITEGTYTGQVTISGNGGNITIPIDYLVDVEKLSHIPTKYSLSQNYPNPFNPSTLIEFSIPRSSNVSLKIYDMLGKEVSSLLNEKKQQGTYKVTFDASNLPNSRQGLVSGVYVYRLETDEFIDTKKFVLLK